MSEQIEIFQAMNAHRQEERRERRVAHAATLRKLGVNMQEKNLGAHLIIRHNGLTVDFWPGTERWMVRSDSGRPRRGFEALLDRLKIVVDPASGQ